LIPTNTHDGGGCGGGGNCKNANDEDKDVERVRSRKENEKAEIGIISVPTYLLSQRTPGSSCSDAGGVAGCGTVTLGVRPGLPCAKLKEKYAKPVMSYFILPCFVLCFALLPCTLLSFSFLWFEFRFA
jgi:hypothetical protein